MKRGELTPAQIREVNARTLADLHPGWQIAPGRPWTARKGREVLTAADAIDIHERLRSQT